MHPLAVISRSGLSTFIKRLRPVAVRSAENADAGKRRVCRWPLLVGLLISMTAQSDVLDQAISLRTEGDLIQAVSITLQHAVETSVQYQGSEPRLQNFARNEISARRKPIDQLNKLGRIQSRPVKRLAIVPTDDGSYRRAMLRNHARLIELIEYGEGLPLSPKTKRLLEAVARDAAAEFALLSQLEKS